MNTSSIPPRRARPGSLVNLALILLAYLLLGWQYARLTPAWQAPDEPAHYNVIRQIAQTGALPRLEPGDYDQAYLARLTAERFPPELSIASIQYQDYQPPLYYLLAAPVFGLFGGALLPLRLFSLALGAGVISLAWLAVSELTGPGSSLPWLTAGLIAFIPQHLAMLASVNNDALAELVIALGLWLAARAARRPGAVPAWLFGLVLGAAFLTKVQAYVLAPALAVYLVLRAWRAGPNRRALLRPALIIFGLGLALGGLYWGRNWLVCGPFDLVCGAHHNQIVVGQPTTAAWAARYGWYGAPDSLLNRFVVFTFDSFWGVFGWMGVFMDQRIYWALALFSAALALGAGAALRGWRALTPAQQDSLTVWACSGLTTLALYLYYNLGFVQHQGRYLFPGLVPLGLAAAIGLRWWETQIARLRPVKWLPAGWLGWGSLAGLLLLDALALYRFVLPALVR